MIEVTERDFSIDEVVRGTRRPEMGAIVMFLGTVRNNTQGRTVKRLEFESYDGVDVEKLQEIRQHAIERFGVSDVSIVHRTGTLEVGENIVIIAVGAAHRDEAFRACRFCIERLKETVPIWKKEYTNEGEYWVSEQQDEQHHPEGSRHVRMVDISEKPFSVRTAHAVGDVVLKPETVELVRTGRTKKGDVIAVAETAGIIAAKRTSGIIPLCHQIPLTSVSIEFMFLPDRIRAGCEVAATYATGVEMEALVGVTTALLTVWDMVKYLEKDEQGQYPTARIVDIRVTKKEKVPIDDT